MKKLPDTEEKILDEKRLTAMKVNILEIEKENIKTRDKTNDEMVEGIKKIIIDELKKKY